MTRMRLQRMIGQSKGNQLTTGRTGLGNQSETRPVSHTLSRKNRLQKQKLGLGILWDILGGDLLVENASYGRQNYHQLVETDGLWN